MNDTEAPPTLESKQSLLVRVTLLTAFQQFLCLALALYVHHSPTFATWLESNLWLLVVDIALSVLVVLVFQLSVQFESVRLLRGFPGIGLMLLFMPTIALLYGGFLSILITTESFIIGISLLMTCSILGSIYLIWQKPENFKAHVVIPVGLMMSLALYGGLLVMFHSVMTAHLMLWTFFEAGYIIYFSLDLQDISLDKVLAAEDFVAGTIRIYSDVVVYAVGMFQTKTMGKGK